MLIAIAIAEKILELPMITLNSIWSQKSDFRTLVSETTFKKSEFRTQNSKIRNQYSELTYPKQHAMMATQIFGCVKLLQIRIQKSVLRNKNSELRIQKSEFRIQKSELRIQKSEISIQN